MKKAALALALALVASTAAADFIEISRSDQGWTYGVDPDTFKIATNDGGLQVAVAVFEVKESGGRRTYEMNLIALRACEAGYGPLVTTDLGGRKRYHTEVARGGSSVGVTIASLLCTAAGYEWRRGSRQSQRAPESTL